jgi:hypothetical protein
VGSALDGLEVDLHGPVPVLDLTLTVRLQVMGQRRKVGRGSEDEDVCRCGATIDRSAWPTWKGGKRGELGHLDGPMMPACSSHAREYEIIGSFPIGRSALHMFSFSDRGYSLQHTVLGDQRTRPPENEREPSTTHDAPCPARITAWNSLRPLRGAENMMRRERDAAGVGCVRERGGR